LNGNENQQPLLYPESSGIGEREKGRKGEWEMGRMGEREKVELETKGIIFL